MRVIRRDLVPSKSVLRRGVRRASKGRLMMVKEAADLAAQGLQTLGYKVPEDRTLQQVLRKRMLSKGGIRSALKNPDRMTPAFDLAGFVLAEISDLERVPPKPQTHAPRRRQLKSKQIANHGRTAKPKQQPPKAKTTAPARQDDSLAFLAELPAQFLRERWGTMPPLERAQVLTEMLSYGASRRQIARWLGIDEKTVRNVLKLAQLPPQYKALLKRKASVRRVLRDANDVDLQQRLRVERDNQTGEHSRNVAQALIEILEQEPNLFPGERAAIARELGRDPTDIRKQRYKNVLPAWDLQAALLACKPHRAAVLDTLTTMDFYTTWIVRAVERLAPEPEIRDRAARIFLTHRFK